MGKPEDKLNNLLQGELAAVETYNMALEKLTASPITPVLTQCRDCHAGRVGLLEQKVRSYGAEPALSSGPWGAFAKLVAAGSVVLGEEPALGSLKEGEDQGLSTYTSEAKNADDECGQFVAQHLLARQEDTQKAITALSTKVPQ